MHTIPSVSYTHLDVYKRQVDEYLTVSQAYVTAPDVKVPDEFSKLFKTVDEAVSYTHLDVYKRQLRKEA